MLAWPLRVAERADEEPFGKAARRSKEAPASAIGSGRSPVGFRRAVVSGKVHDGSLGPDWSAPLGHGDSRGRSPRPATRNPLPPTTVVRVTLPPSGSVRDLAARYGIRPSKALGQNFLLDPNLAKAIVSDAGVMAGDWVVEVGAGLGSLTRAIAEAGPERVLALEFDRSLLPALKEAVADLPSVEVIHADATKLDWDAMLGAGPWILCANLPYNVGTTIVLDVLESVPQVERLVVMLQREVGERLVAAPGEDAYGAVSVKVAFHARAGVVRRVPPEVFWPRPSVGSVMVGLVRLASPPVTADPAKLWEVVGEAFSQRRKTMGNALRRLGLDLAAAEDLMRRCGLDPAARAEELGLEDFALICEAMP